MKKIIILLGVPGSGKGTQAKRLVNRFDYAHISTGDLLRGLHQRTDLDDELLTALEKMKTGAIVSTNVIKRLAFEAIEQGINEKAGVILDGAIRNIEQAEAYQEFFASHGWEDEVIVVNVHITDEESFARLERRLEYAKKGEVVPALAESKSGGQVEEARKDDDPEVARQRLEVQGNKALQPLFEYYEGKGILKTVDGTQSIDQVEEEIVSILAQES